MDAIADLEGARRGLYTGAYGLMRHDGGLELAMAIRVLTCSGGRGRYFAGGGIVADSDPAREVDETHWKAVQVLDAAVPRKLASIADTRVAREGPKWRA
jgi:anthranilate/para-aminobenzoate synthase component I